MAPGDGIADPDKEVEHFGRAQLRRDPQTAADRVDVGHRQRIERGKPRIDGAKVGFHTEGLDVEFHARIVPPPAIVAIVGAQGRPAR